MNGAGLVDFYREYAPSRVPSAKSRRAQQNIAKRYRLPIIKIGNSVLIDPEAGDARLRELALHHEPVQRRRGRPRTIVS